MRRFGGLAAALLLAGAAQLCGAQALPDASSAARPALVAFASEEGLARFAQAVAKVDFPALANQFEAQSNAAFCGPTTAAIVLNALRNGNTPTCRATAAACSPTI